MKYLEFSLLSLIPPTSYYLVQKLSYVWEHKVLPPLASRASV